MSATVQRSPATVVDLAVACAMLRDSSHERAAAPCKPGIDAETAARWTLQFVIGAVRE